MAFPKLPVRSLGGPALLLLLLQSLPAHAENLDRLAERLVNLRGEVEELNSQLEDLRDRHKNEMSSLSRRKSDLEGTVQRRQVKIDEMRKDLADKRAKAKKAGVKGEALKPVVADAIVHLKTRIRRGLPFKEDKRLGELEEIQQQLRTDALSPHQVAKRLWGFYEDEIRLAKESGVYQQTIRLDDEERLADVARIGMVAMFFRTPDGRFGEAVRDGGQWRYRVLRDEQERGEVKTLFDDFRKQVRTGFFTIPNALPGMEDL
ncbi:MAG TPA: DUF3450 family protein [Gammaproteobacteria bacterium]|nr:DUF3450 family protein [Gammaproteobacteria bacterium]